MTHSHAHIRTQTARQLEDHPEKRTPVAREILSSEVSYMRTLEIIKDVFFMPCKAALDSNRAVLSAHNMQIIFADPMGLMELSKSVQFYTTITPHPHIHTHPRRK